jgi:hypothetical protein
VILCLQNEPCDICGDGGFEELIATCSKCSIAREHVYDNTALPLSLSLSLSLSMEECDLYFPHFLLE